jgi:hypothetical protein
MGFLLRKSAMSIRIAIVLTFVLAAHAAEKQESKPTLEKPVMSIDLRSYGYQVNAGSILDFAIKNIGPNLAVLSEKLAIVYHTVPDKQTAAGSPGTLVAYTVDLSTGRLIRKQEWRTTLGMNWARRTDSEARIVVLSQGRYAVMASGTLHIYDGDGSILREKVLEAGTWAVQAVDGGKVLLLRHGNAGPDGAETRYLWADADSLETLAAFDDTHPYRSEKGLLGVGRMLVDPEEDGLYGLSADGNSRLLCSEEFCRAREIGDVEGINDGVVLSSRFGVGVLSLSKGVLWFLRVTPDEGLDRIMVVPTESSGDGSRVAAYVSRGRKYRTFDGVKLASPVEIFVYSAEEGKRLAIVPGGTEVFSLSPEGHTLVLFDQTVMEVYSIQ